MATKQALFELVFWNALLLNPSYYLDRQFGDFLVEVAQHIEMLVLPGF